MATGRVSRLVNRSTGRVLSERVRIAVTGGEQMRGWMGYRPEFGEVLGLPGCAAVHTFFVPAPIDLVFCGSDGTVLRAVAACPPFRPGITANGTTMVWEGAANALAPFVTPGDRLEPEYQ